MDGRCSTGPSGSLAPVQCPDLGLSQGREWEILSVWAGEEEEGGKGEGVKRGKVWGSTLVWGWFDH